MSEPANKDVRWGKRGYGFVTPSGKFYMVRCGACGRENWAMAVASGQCCWCGDTGPEIKQEARGEAPCT